MHTYIKAATLAPRNAVYGRLRRSGHLPRTLGYLSLNWLLSLTLLAFYTGGNGLIELLPTKDVVNVGVVPPI